MERGARARSRSRRFGPGAERLYRWRVESSRPIRSSGPGLAGLQQQRSRAHRSSGRDSRQFFYARKPVRDFFFASLRRLSLTHVSSRHRYSQADGHPELVASLLAYYAAQHGWSLEPSNVLITTSATEGLYVAMQALLDEGDEVSRKHKATLLCHLSLRTATGCDDGASLPVVSWSLP